MTLLSKLNYKEGTGNIFYSLKDLNPRVKKAFITELSNLNDNITDLQKEMVDDTETYERETKRRIIEKHIIGLRHNSLLESVVSGKTTFTEYCMPIIKKCRYLEERLKNTKKDSYFSTWDLYGSGERNKIRRTLEKEKIILPNEYFNSREILTAKKFERIEKLTGPSMSFSSSSNGYCYGMIATGIGMVINTVIFKELNMLSNTSLVISFIPYMFLTPYIIHKIDKINKNAIEKGLYNLTDERRKFEEDLKYLDNEIRKLYPM